MTRLDERELAPETAADRERLRAEALAHTARREQERVERQEQDR